MRDDEQGAAFLHLGFQEIDGRVALFGVKSLGGFVGDEDAGATGAGGEKGHALCHAAGKLMRQLAVRPREPQRRQGPDGALQRLGGPLAAHAPKTFGDLAADAVGRVERQPWLLGEDGEFAAPKTTAFRPAHRLRVPAVDQDGAACRQPVGQRPGDRLGQQALARTGLAQDREGHAAFHAERDAAHDRILGGDADVPHFDGGRHRVRPPAIRLSASTARKTTRTGWAIAHGAS